MPCFDANGFATLSIGTLLLYQTWWGTFERIQEYDINVSTLRQAGNTSLTYYTYMTMEERNEYTNGRMLHISRYPNSNWNPVEKN